MDREKPSRERAYEGVNMRGANGVAWSMLAVICGVEGSVGLHYPNKSRVGNKVVASIHRIGTWMLRIYALTLDYRHSLRTNETKREMQGLAV